MLIFPVCSEPKTRWLDAISDGTAGLKTIASCMNVCDLKNDNYYKLIASEIPFEVDARPRLRVYKGTQVINEQGLPGIPSSVQSLYIDESHPKMPSKTTLSLLLALLNAFLIIATQLSPLLLARRFYSTET